MSLVRLLLFVAVVSCLVLLLSCSVPEDITREPSYPNVFFEGDVADSTGDFRADEKPVGWNVEPVRAPKKEFHRIVFADGNNGWLAAPRELYRTVDGGATWKQLPLQVPKESGIATFQFADAMNGWMTFEKKPVSYYDPQFRVDDIHCWVFGTHDGGETWEAQFEEKGVRISELAILRPGILVVTGGKYLEEPRSGTESYVRYSDDGGRRWTDVSSHYNEAKTAIKTHMSYMFDEPSAISLTARGQIKLISHSRTVMETNDGGITWQFTGQYAHDDQQVGIKNFGNKDDGTEWMFESTYSIEGIRARLKTRDLSDNLTRNVVHGAYLSNVYYLGNDSFIAAGKAGDLRRDQDEAIIWLTDNNGRNWSELYRNRKAHDVVSLSFVSRRLLWAICDDGTVIRLTREF